jgi:type VI protein secretion system component VasK
VRHILIATGIVALTVLLFLGCRSYSQPNRDNVGRRVDMEVQRIELAKQAAVEDIKRRCAYAQAQLHRLSKWL